MMPDFDRAEAVPITRCTQMSLKKTVNVFTTDIYIPLDSLTIGINLHRLGFKDVYISNLFSRLFNGLCRMELVELLPVLW